MDEVKKEREKERVKKWTNSRDYISESDCTSVLGLDLSVLESRHGPDMQFGPCSDPTAIWFQTCLFLHLFPGLDPTKLGPRPGTESNLSPGPNPNKFGHGPGTESPGLCWSGGPLSTGRCAFSEIRFWCPQIPELAPFRWGLSKT